MQPTRLAALALATSLTLFAGSCGKQDLYELPDSPYPEVGHLPLPSINENVEILGDYAFIAAGQAGLHVVDLADPAHPQLVQTLNTTKYADGIKVVRTFVGGVVQDIALVVEGTEGITSYDITDPPNTVSFNQGTTAVDGNGMFVIQHEDPDEPYEVFLAESWKGVRIFESLPAFPGVLAYNGVFAGTQGYAMGIAVKDGYAYVADDQMGLAVLDARVLALGSVELVSWADTPGNALAVSLWDDYAFVADKRQGMAVFRINGPDTPVHVAQMPLDGWCQDIVVRDDMAFIAANDAGVHVVNVHDPAHPVYAGNVRSSNATGVAVGANGVVLVTDEDDGLLVLKGPAFDDLTPPGAIYTLEAEALSTSSVGLAWKATGDDGTLGRASGFELRYAAAPINTAAAWDAATPVTGLPLPGDPGDAHTFTVGGLSGDTEYFFCVRVTDDEGQQSPLGPGASATTFPTGTFLSNLAVTPEFGDDEATYTFTVLYSDTDGDAPVTHDLVLDGTPVAMTYVSGEYTDGALYQYAGLLAPGQHSYSAAFDDGNGHAPVTDTAQGPLVGDEVYTMGSPPGEPGQDADERQHTVLLSQLPVAEATEVTQAQWKALMGPALPDSTFLGDTLPVLGLTWYEAVSYCNARSVDEGLTPAYTVEGADVSWNTDADGYRLPTEAEWEWLCRAGSGTAFHNGAITDQNCDDPVLDVSGWYCGNSGDAPQTGAGLLANAFGLSDMHGNAMEWCWDWYAGYPADPALDPQGPSAGFQKVARGGSWYVQAKFCRSAAREGVPPDSRLDTVGLRVVRTAGN